MSEHSTSELRPAPQTGRSQCQVANAVSVWKSVIIRLCNRYKQTKHVDDRPRSGHYLGNDRLQDRFIPNQTLRKRFQTEIQMFANLRQATDIRVTGQMIRNCLHPAHRDAPRHRVVSQSFFKIFGYHNAELPVVMFAQLIHYYHITIPQT